jgi:hypothetical protein
MEATTQSRTADHTSIDLGRSFDMYRYWEASILGSNDPRVWEQPQKPEKKGYGLFYIMVKVFSNLSLAVCST